MVHNFYGSSSPSGENQAYEAEKALLQAHGHEVSELTRHSDEIRNRGALGTVRGAFATAWNPWMARAAKQMVERLRPDVVHVHNTFPLISPAVFHAVGASTARVLTLHNYRLFCAAAIPMREGRVCTECLDRRSSWPSLRHGCYRGSRMATLPLALNVGLHRWLGTWQHEVDAFIALSEFQRQLMSQAGLPARKVHVKPNFHAGSPSVIPWGSRLPYAIFVGRLKAEKGVSTLLRAWRAWGLQAPELRIVGDGELRAELEGLAAGLPVKFLGQIGPAEAQAQIAAARLLILPSEWYEGFPMVIGEAFAMGTPVAVSNIGPLPSIVKHGTSGIVFEPGSPESLLGQVRKAWESAGMLERLSLGARAEFEAHYTSEANYLRLKAIYERAIEMRLGRGA